MFYRDDTKQKEYSSLLSFTVTDINNTVSKLMALGAELDGPIKYEIHGKVYTPSGEMILSFHLDLVSIINVEIRPGYIVVWKLELVTFSMNLRHKLTVTCISCDF